jgi:hypothetical protein
MTDQDDLIIKAFDSVTRPSKLDNRLSNPVAKSKDNFKKRNCPSMMPPLAPTTTLQGTDLKAAWKSVYDEHLSRKVSFSNGDSRKGVRGEVAIFYVDAIEPVTKPQSNITESENEPDTNGSVNELKNSIQKFVEDHNDVIFLIARDSYKELLANELESVEDKDKNILLLNPNSDLSYRKKVEEVIKKSRARI